jgi:hypothetical protein
MVTWDHRVRPHPGEFPDLLFDHLLPAMKRRAIGARPQVA